MSYQLTYNESFILTVIMMIGGIWSIAVIFEGLSTVHDYDFKQTVVSLIITAVFMLIAAIVVLVSLLVLMNAAPTATQSERTHKRHTMIAVALNLFFLAACNIS